MAAVVEVLVGKAAPGVGAVIVPAEERQPAYRVRDPTVMVSDQSSVWALGLPSSRQERQGQQGEDRRQRQEPPGAGHPRQGGGQGLESVHEMGATV